MNILQEKAARRFIFSLLFIFLLSLLLNVILVLEQGRFTRRLLLEQSQAVASALLEEQVPRDLVARALTGTRTSPEGIRLLKQLGMAENASLPSLRLSDFSIVCSFLSLLLIFALLFAAAFRFFLGQERLYENAISVIASYTEGRFEKQLPQSCGGTIYRLFTSVNHMAAALKSGQELERQTKDFLKNTISDISHQLKTPLAALSMYNEILLEEPDQVQTVRTFALKSGAAIDRMQTLILSLLKIARLDSRAITFQKRTCPVKELLLKAAEPLTQRAAQEQKTFSFLNLSAKTLFCDPIWTAEALGNLLKNALEHSPSGGEIQISFQQTALEAGVRVSDKGPGIPPEDFHHIFKRFYRSKASADSPGTGLGLPLAQAIAQGQGGRIDVQNLPGLGCAFTLYLPLSAGLQNCKEEFTSL